MQENQEPLDRLRVKALICVYVLSGRTSHCQYLTSPTVFQTRSGPTRI